MSTRTEEFEYEPARRGRTRRATKKLTEAATDESTTAEPLVDPTGPYMCPICNEKFNYDYGLLLHVDCHPVSPCTCLLCGAFFGSAYGLVMHHLKKHKTNKKIKWSEDIALIETESNSTMLELIPFGISSKSRVSKEQGEIHDYKSGFICPSCHRVFPIYNGLRMHYVECVLKQSTRRSNRKSTKSLQTSRVSTKEQFFDSLGLKKRNETPEVNGDGVQPELDPFQPVSGVTFQRVICGGTYATLPAVCGKTIRYYNCAGEEATDDIKEEPVTPERIQKTPNTTPKARKRLPRKPLVIKEDPEPKKVKREVPDPIGPHHCKLCADSFFTETELNHHERTKHADVEVTKYFVFFLFFNNGSRIDFIFCFLQACCVSILVWNWFDLFFSQSTV